MYRGIIGAKPSRQNQREQARENAKALKKAEGQASSSSSIRPTLEELFGSLLINWASPIEAQMIGEVINQGEKDICWAICLARLLQAYYNKDNPHDRNTFSFEALVGHIKPNANEKGLGLANLKKALKHIRDKGMLKTPIRGVGKAGDKGKTVQEDFDLVEDIDYESIRKKLDNYPVALRLQIEPGFSENRGQVYYLPKKKVTTKNTILHCILLVAYGMTQDGELFFIGQNTWGEEWGRQGYIPLIIKHKCDIICRKE